MAPTATPPNPSNPGGPDSPGTGPAAFSQLLDATLRERHRVAADPQWALRAGELQAQVLCRYAAGKVSTPERREVEGYLTRAPWAMERVVALVRGGRAETASPLAGQILAAAQNGDVDPYRTAAMALLETLQQTQALDVVEKQDASGLEPLEADPLVHAACLLGLGQRSEAADAFAKLSDLPSPLAETAKRVATLEDDEEALVELLSAI